MSLKLMLEEVVGRYGGKTAIVSGERRLSYADLDEASNKVANALIRMGVNKGDRVAMLLSNSPEFVIIYFGIVKTGAIAVPLDTTSKVPELISLFDDFLPKVLVAESINLEPLAPVLSRFKSIRHVIDLGAEKDEGHLLSYRGIMAASSGRRIDVELAPEDIADITYASGPVFHPRGVVLSHQHLVTEAAVSAGGFKQTDKDVTMLFALPMYHMLGMVGVMLASICQGSTVVIVPGTGLSISNFMAAIEREKGTMFLGVPYIFVLLVDMAEREGIKHDLSSIRLWCSAGAPLSVNIAKRFKQYYGSDILDAWGLTETVCHITCPPINGSGRLGSIGKALPGWEVKVVDEGGQELPPNQAGELIVSGPLMKGYYNNPQATAEVIKDGWLYSGDIGKVDEDGYLFITGRKKDMVIVKGQNVYPSDIERVLATHPKVAEVAVLGIADELRGEVVGAVISLREGKVATEQEIRQFCLERIASYRVPRQVVFLDSLPRTAAGKIDKEAIREHLSIPSPFPEIAIS